MEQPPTRPDQRHFRHGGVIDAFLARAALRGERVVAVTRLVLAGLLLLLWLGAGLSRLGSAVTHWAALACYCSAIAYSLWVLFGLGPRHNLKRHLDLSVSADTLILAMVLVPSTLLPHANYHGFLREVNFSVVILGIVATGVRLSRRTALLGSALMVALLATLLLIDGQLHPELINYGWGYGLTAAIFVLGAVVLAYTVASRTRRLVGEGAEAAVQAEQARQRLGIYVSEEVADEALRRTSLRLGGQRQTVAVLFSDLRGFTAYSEARPPESIVVELNAYLGAMVDAIRAEGGVVDKFIGDAIMAVFGITEPGEGDAARAIRAAAGMQRALAAHNEKRQQRGRPSLRHGIGVHYGPAVAGNIGSRERLQFTVIGETVNRASRLESATKTTAHAPVLISAEAVEAAKRATGPEASADALPPLRPHAEIALPGYQAPVPVFTLDE